MAIIIKTNDPEDLMIRIQTEMEVYTDRWEALGNGIFNHKSHQPADDVTLRIIPKFNNGELILGISMEIEPGDNINRVYNEYHKDFVDMLLGHLKGHFNLVSVTAQTDSRYDDIRTRIKIH